MENTAEIIHLKFPIGDFIKKDEYTTDEIASLAEVIEHAPAAYKRLTETLSANDLSKTYRPGSCNILQCLHGILIIIWLILMWR